MFVNEFSPLFQAFAVQPIAFAGGFVSSLLRLNLADEPVKSWLNRKAGVTVAVNQPNVTDDHGPQNIAID